MKNIYTFLLPFFVTLSAFSQNEATIVWQKCLGGSGWEDLMALQKTNDGGFIIAGETGSNDGDIIGNQGGYDGWIVKTDSSGNLQWQKCLGGTLGDWIESIQQTIDGGYIVAGSTSSNDGDVSGNHGGGSDAWLLKLDGLGNIQWQKCYGGTDTDNAEAIECTFDGGFVFAGSTRSNDDDVTGLHGIGNNDDGWVVKIDSIGNIQWQKCLGGSYSDYCSSIKEIASGGYIIAGNAGSLDGDDIGNHGLTDAWIVRLDSGGNLLWSKCYGGSNYDNIREILQTLDGGYIFSATSKSNNYDMTFNHGGYDAWIVKIDSSGNIEWQKSFGGAGDDDATFIIQTDDGGYMVGGDTDSNDGDVSGNHGNTDSWIYKLDATGNMVWQRCMGGNGFDAWGRVQQINASDFIFASWVDSSNGDVFGSHGGGDCWLVRLTTKYNSIKGTAFIDLNSNSIQDTTEPSLLYHTIHESITGRITLTQQNGSYALAILDSGNYSVYPSAVPYYNSVPVSRPVYFSGIYQTDSLNDFAFQPTGSFSDLNVTITPISPFRPGFNALYRIHYKNVGTTSLVGTVIFYPDPNVSFVSSIPIPSTITLDSMIWTLPVLAPYDEGNILVTVLVNGSAVIGSHLYSSANIEPIPSDANPIDNFAQWDVTVVAAHDPNEILVSRYSLTTTEVASQPYLDYVIHFQNTGNDTAFNVKILNVIPLNLDLSSFEFLEASHPVQINFNNSDRQLSFEFNNILLADSNANETLSHGYLRYRIKPLATLVAGDSIANKAYITFDFNASIGTNYAITEITLPTFVLSPGSTHDFVIYPNPASSSFTIQTDEYFKKGEVVIYDVLGKEVFYKKLTSSKTEIQETLQRGIYFVKVKNDESSVVKKLVVN